MVMHVVLLARMLAILVACTSSHVNLTLIVRGNMIAQSKHAKLTVHFSMVPMLVGERIRGRQAA